MTGQIWLAADYHFPITYSCRMPMSSPYSAMALLAPGPTTIRMALIRTSIEIYGLEQTRHILFPIIRAAEIFIQPPEKLAVSSHPLHLYKADDQYNLNMSFGYREFAHTDRLLTIFIQIPVGMQERFSELFDSIGYWGQASSLAVCRKVYSKAPSAHKVIQSLTMIGTDVRLGDFVTTFISNWIDNGTKWDNIVQSDYKIVSLMTQPMLYVFPHEICERRSSGIQLVYRSLEEVCTKSSSKDGGG